MSKLKHIKLLRYLIVGLVVFLVLITFTPVILRTGKIEPKLLSMPFTLWSSLLITILIVVLTYLFSKVQDKD